MILCVYLSCALVGAIIGSLAGISLQQWLLRESTPTPEGEKEGE